MFRVGTQIRKLQLHRPDAATDEVLRLLKLVGIPAAELRIKATARNVWRHAAASSPCVAARPKLLVATTDDRARCDHQAQIIELLRDLKQQLGMAILLITHNLALSAISQTGWR